MLHLIITCYHTLLAPVLFQGILVQNAPQNGATVYTQILVVSVFHGFIRRILLMTFNTIMNVTIKMNLQKIQVMLDGRSSFLQGGLENNPSDDSVKVPSQVLEVNITLFFCDYCRHITPLYI
jgi:hypothetical protein